MRFISWNVNGLRACMGKGFQEFFDRMDADFFCLQETKLQEGQIEMNLSDRQQFWNYAEKKGYSGTAIFAKQEPISVRYGVGVEQLDTEGRMVTLEYPEFFLVTCYTPNAQRELTRLAYRMDWENAFLLFQARVRINSAYPRVNAPRTRVFPLNENKPSLTESKQRLNESNHHLSESISPVNENKPMAPNDPIR